MPIIHKKTKNEGRFEERKDLKKLCFHVTIVPSGQAPVINKLFKTLGVACQFSQKGRGTASKRVREILGLEENYKDLIISLIPEDLVPTISTELEAYFAANIRNRGIGFVVPMDSIISVRVYNFIADLL